MTIEKLYIGSTRRLYGFFRVNNVLTNPGAVSIKIRKPDGTINEYTYAGSTVTRESTGVYYKDITFDQHGVWKFRITGTSPVATAEEGTFPEVLDSPFD